MIFSAFERLVAFRYLRARREEGLISAVVVVSLLGIALGVAVLIIVMSVMNGFHVELLNRILGVQSHITVQSMDGPLPDYDAIAERLKRLPGVRSVAPMVDGQVFVSANGKGTGGYMRGYRQADFKNRSQLSTSLVDGSIEDFHGEDAAIVGIRMAQALQLGIGSTFKAISPQTTTTMAGQLPRIREFTVVAIFDVGMYEYDSTYVFIPLEAAQIYFKQYKGVDKFEVMANDAEQVGQVKVELAQALGPGFQLSDWQLATANFFGAVEVERTVMFVILTLIVLVAALNIIAGQLMVVKEKGRNIAIMRTMGATRGAILRVFLLSGTSIGAVGTLLGCLLGISFAMNIETIRQWLEQVSGRALFNPVVYFLSRLPAIIDWTEVAFIAAITLTLTVLAALYPAWRAARLDPVEALRYE